MEDGFFTSGHYEYLVMSYELVKAPSLFQAFNNDVFRDMLNLYVMVYLDNILIYSTLYPGLVKYVRAVLDFLLKHRLYVKAEKQGHIL